MNRRVIFVPCLLALMSAAASADLIQPGYKRIQPVLAFEGLDDHPEYKFFLYIYISAVGPRGPRLEPIKDSKPFVPKWGSAGGAYHLLALPKHADERVLRTERRRELPTAPGLMSCGLDVPPTYGLVSQPNETSTTFEVKIKDGKLVAAPATRPKSGAADPKSGSSIFYGLSIALLALTIGMLLRRRLTGAVP